MATIVAAAPDIEARLPDLRAALEAEDGGVDAGASGFDGFIVARLVSPSPTRLRAALIAAIVALGGRKPGSGHERRRGICWTDERREEGRGPMNLTPREKDKLLIAMAAMVARRRLERGVKLNHPEAVALITDFVVEGARDGRSVAELMEAGAHVVGRRSGDGRHRLDDP